MRSSSLLTAVAAAACMLPLASAFAKDEALAKAIASEHRSPNFVERDAARKPQAVLEFIGVKPNQTVVEIAPGGGYWTEILGPYLHDKGTYYTAITPRAASERAATAADTWQKKLDSDKARYGKVKIGDFGGGKFEPAPAGSADVVVTFRNVHNWMGQGTAEQAFASFYKALKPGGILGVEEHRASNDQPQDPKAASGYVREDYTIALAEKAGFKLLASSPLLNNPKDTKDYPKGVWTLPPTLALGDQDRAKYTAIGESDNFLLKFQKPQ
ncbi:class I SAM-dependent methyltransferase [Steroidobacter sp.]|uniref:class I SAM-dependent methyltransferase n=1 Tax=Steroidobacter sp. TaxID=1978227 RepID=UPI001A4436FD|nr:methyltransferase domain-containing protein [Steroidobacter sp.]MBL8271188.1 class I SAM-dependent methyltransferase [Steroidobacter sp.]